MTILQHSMGLDEGVKPKEHTHTRKQTPGKDTLKLKEGMGWVGLQLQMHHSVPS